VSAAAAAQLLRFQVWPSCLMAFYWDP
jgi:hypothetical protein